MTIPYHTHTFDVPTASGAEVIAGSNDTKAVTPLSLAGVRVPAGGTTGQVLQKTSGTDNDVAWATPGTGVTDHGLLTGLADDDHTQYLLANGTGRNLSGILSYGSHPTFNSDTQVVDKKYVDDKVATVVVVTDHGVLTGLADDDHTQYILATGTRDFSGKVKYTSHPTFSADTELVDKKYVDDKVATVVVVTDHGVLTGLADDDHTQYILATGTRDFSGKVKYTSHPTFSADTELVDKKYVDDAITGGGGYTDEQAQDAVGNILNGTRFTYNDGAGTIDLSSSVQTSLGKADTAVQPGAIGLTVQGYDADLASWATVTRASGFDTFAATPSSANLASLVTNETGSGALVFGTSPTITTPALTDPSITGAILEDIYTISDGAGFEIDPGNGTIQLITLGANRTPAATNFANGESVTLMIADGTAYTITWSTVAVVWAGGSAPTLATTGYTVVVLWKVGGTVYGSRVGDVA